MATNTKRTVTSGSDGSPIPVTVDLNVAPLTHSCFVDGVFVKNKPIVTGSGREVMNDEWIYVFMPNHGHQSINVNRANYCRKIYLMNTKIKDSITKPVSKRLQKFIDEVADTLVFIKNGISYRVELTEGKKEMDLKRVYPYWALAGTGGINCVGMPFFGKETERRYRLGSVWGVEKKKYGPNAGQGGNWGTDLKETFGFDF